jgi:hypothetical protein
MCNITFVDPSVLIANLKAALLAASTDKARENFHVVRIVASVTDGEEVRFIGTNGHWLWANTVTAPDVLVDGVNEISISVQDVKLILKGLKKKGGAVRVDLCALGKVVQDGDTVHTFAPVDARFPPYHQIIPAIAGTKRVPILADASYVAAICEAFCLVSSGRTTGVAFDAGTSNETQDQITATSKDAPNALAILMPRNDSYGFETQRAKYRMAPVTRTKVA